MAKANAAQRMVYLLDEDMQTLDRLRMNEAAVLGTKPKSRSAMLRTLIHAAHGGADLRLAPGTELPENSVLDGTHADLHNRAAVRSVKELLPYDTAVRLETDPRRKKTARRAERIEVVERDEGAAE